METRLQPHVRAAELGDAKVLAELFDQLGFPCSSQELIERMSAVGDIALVALIEERVVGVITINIMPVLHRPHPVGRISALVVDQTLRGAGIGKSLVLAAEALLVSRGCELIEVTSNFRLEQAHHFYKSVGYEATSYRFKKDVGAASRHSTV